MLNQVKVKNIKMYLLTVNKTLEIQSSSKKIEIMGAPHNTKRYGELWPQDRIDTSLLELQFLREFIILSGGWAWHFLSPEEHIEYKHAHAHKDIDDFVDPKHVSEVMECEKYQETYFRAGIGMDMGDVTGGTMKCTFS